MKRKFSLILCAVFLLLHLFTLNIFAQELPVLISPYRGEENLVITPNTSDAYINGEEREISQPLVVMGKTYVDLYSVAPLLKANVSWVENGNFKAEYNGEAIEFSLVQKWDDIKLSNKYFVKDGLVYVSLRELADFTDNKIDFDNWVITVSKSGERNSLINESFGEINPQSSDTYLYSTYCYTPEHVVYPYDAYSYEYMINDAQRLSKMYPELIHLGSIGNSVEGRDLLLIEFGKGEKKIFVCGTHHAREYIATTYLMYAIDQYAYAYKTSGMWGNHNVRDILDSVTFCIVPMVNPDGVNLVQNGIYATKNPEYVASMSINEKTKHGYASWKANINGVDVNWNYDKDWVQNRKGKPRGSIGFEGDAPNTEPETRAVSAYVDSYPFEAFISYHTQGQYIYWAEDKENRTYMGELIKKDTGFGMQYEKDYGTGGSFFDYVYRKYKKPTLTVELCRFLGNYPFPDSQFDSVWKPAKNILLIAGEVIKGNV